MPQELPGFYFDAEKNRYFPIKGPIPGTPGSASSTAAHNTNSKPAQGTSSCQLGARTSKLLQVRELNGSILPLTKGKCNFKEEFQKRLVSQPVGCQWKFGNISCFLIKCTGQEKNCFTIGKVGQHSDDAEKFIPDRMRCLINKSKTESFKAPVHVWKINGASVVMALSLSCIKLSGKHSSCATDDGSNIQHALITSLGSETSGGSVFVLNLAQSFNIGPGFSFVRHNWMHMVCKFNCTIWTADCSTYPTQAVIGTNLGAAVVNLETGLASWICSSKSDVLAQQLIQSGNVVLCELRNGAIVTVDIRERQQWFSSRTGRRHCLPYSPFQRTGRNSDKQWFELKGNICPSQTIFIPSSISCLQSLHCYDQYFLASLMNGMVKLYDHHLMKRGPIQSYEGNVNSHTQTQLGVDQSERFVMSGGEDYHLRVWSIKSVKLLFDDKFSNSVPSAVC